MDTAKSTENLLKSKSKNRDTGEAGEKIALTFLKKKGYLIVAQNYRCCFGEMDIIARDGMEVVFIEVKSRKSSTFGDPELAVDRRKQQKLSRIALHYLAERNLQNKEARFDVVAIYMSPEGNDVHHFTDAFELIL